MTRLLGMATNQIFDGVRNALQNGTVFSVDFTTMGTILLVLIGLYTMGTVFNYIPQRILAGVSQNLILDLRKRISDKLNKLPLKYYDTHKKGQILSRITNDLERVADSVQETMANMITASITLIGAFLMMLMISPSLTLIALVTVIVSAVVSILIGSRTKQYHAANQAALGDLNANIEEAFTGNSLIKAFNLKKEMIMQNDVLNERLRKTSMKAQFITYVINPVVRLIGQFGYVLIAVRGAIAVISGEIRIGDVQAAFQYVNQISEPITQLSYTMRKIGITYTITMNRLFQKKCSPERRKSGAAETGIASMVLHRENGKNSVGSMLLAVCWNVDSAGVIFHADAGTAIQSIRKPYGSV